MCSDDKLTLKKAGGFFNKLHKLFLPPGRQAVFRLIQQIKPVFINVLIKITQRRFPIGVFPDIIHERCSYIFALRGLLRSVAQTQFIQLFHTLKLKVGIFVLRILFQALFSFVVNPLI